MLPRQDPLTETLRRVESGNATADELLPLVYRQLRAIAQERMRGEGRGHTLQATALVHEAWLRLCGTRRVPWSGRAQFFAAAAEAMRRILLDHARSKGRIKRGAGWKRSSQDVVDLAAHADAEEIVALDEALRRLEDKAPDAAAVVRLRFYGGLSVVETASTLGISPRKVNREWAFARAWMFRALEEPLAP